MADKTINVKVAIETANAANSIGEINKSLKELKSAQESVDRSSPDFKKLSDAINKTEGRIGDLNDKFKTLTGSGVEKVNASLGLMSEGFKNLDFDKFKIGLQGTTMSFKALSAAVAATGIGLLIQGISYLINNFDKLKNSGGFIGKMFSAIGDAISFVTDIITKFTDKIGLTESALEKQGEALKTNAEKAKEALEGQTNEYDRQIKAAEAAGKSTLDIEIAKQEAIVETNKKLVEQTIAYVRSGGKLTEEQNKLLTEQLNAIKNAKNEEVVIHEKAEKKKTEESKKHYEEVKKLRDEATAYRIDQLYKQSKFEEEERKKSLEEEKKLHNDILASLNKTLMKQGEAEAAKADQDFIDTENKRAAKKANEKLDSQDMLTNMQKERDAKLNNINLTEAERIEIIRASNEEEKKLAEDLTAKKMEQMDQVGSYARQSMESTKALSDLFFQWQLDKAKGNSEKELKIKKRQFQVEKALKVALIVMDTVMGMVKAISQNTPPSPIGIISAALLVVSGTLATVKVLATKFDPGGGGGGAGSIGSAPTMPSSVEGGESKTPSFGPQTFGINSGAAGVNAGVGGKIGGKEQLPPQKVYVTQGDIADQNKKVEVIQERATIG